MSEKAEILLCPFCGCEVGESGTLCGMVKGVTANRWWCKKQSFNICHLPESVEKVLEAARDVVEAYNHTMMEEKLSPLQNDILKSLAEEVLSYERR